MIGIGAAVARPFPTPAPLAFARVVAASAATAGRENDPGELHNLAGRREQKDVQETLAAALQEKLIADHD